MLGAIFLATLWACVPSNGTSNATGGSKLPLAGTEWRLTELSGLPAIIPDGERKPHVQFLVEDSRFAGFTGCNNMSGRWEQSGSDLRLSGPVAMTRMACLESRLNEQEQKFATALSAMNRHTIVGNVLKIYGPEGELASFEAP
jgi:heat shock protein HslJ